MKYRVLVSPDLLCQFKNKFDNFGIPFVLLGVVIGGMRLNKYGMPLGGKIAMKKHVPSN
jgi:hypothetical protein